MEDAMKHRKVLILAGVLLLVIACGAIITVRLMKDPVPSGTPTAAPEGPGWIDLLGAEHRDAWANITDEKDIFEIRDGMLHIFGRTIHPLRYAGYTGRAFGDFDLHLEYRLVRRCNSGVFLRVQKNDPVRRGFEVQVLDDHGKAPHKNRSGAIYDVVTPMFNMSRPAGEWNSFDITCEGGQVTVRMNGWPVVYTDLALMREPIGKFDIPFAELPREGLIALQDHGGEIWYRNIRIRPHEKADKSLKTR
jgi:hypothetical protein